MANSKITYLRKSVRTSLLTILDRVYYGSASTDTFPYGVFTIEYVTTLDLVTKAELEINVCDYGKNTESLETKCDSIIKLFDHAYTETNNIAFTSYFERKNNVASDDTNIIRRRLVFAINLYDKE